VVVYSVKVNNQKQIQHRKKHIKTNNNNNNTFIISNKIKSNQIKFINIAVLKCFRHLILIHCALSLAAQCIVIGPLCVFATGGRAGVVCVWVYYHDNSFRASIFTKLDV